MKFHTTTLANGLTVLEVPSRDADSVVIDFFVKTGSRSETPRESGISHFLEHFLFKGTKKYPSALAISEQVDAVGGEMNAMTTKESTQYYIKVASKHFGLAFEILTDMLQQPLFTPEELEREKGVIVEEMNMYRDNPMADIGDILERTSWPGQPLGRDIIGSKETVTAFIPEMFQSYLARYYQPGNIILGVSGSYNTLELRSLLKRFWSGLPKKRFGSWTKVQDTQRAPRVEIKYKATEQTHLALGFKAFNYNHPRNVVVSVISAILGGGMSSRLFMEVRERRGLAYYVRASGYNFQDTGLFGVSAGVQVGELPAALTVILQELKRLVDVLVAPDELKKAKEYLKGKTVLALEDTGTRLDWYLDQVAFKKQVRTPDQAFARVDAVTAEDVQKVAQQLFNPKTTNLAVIGPFRKTAALAALIRKHL